MTLTTGTAEDQLRREMAELFDAHGQALWAIARKLCRHQQDAEDVFQDTAARVWKHLAGRPQIVNRRAWLMTIAYRVFLDQRKKANNVRHACRRSGLACQSAAYRRRLARGSKPSTSRHRKPTRGRGGMCSCCTTPAA